MSKDKIIKEVQTGNSAKHLLVEVVKCCDNPDERWNKHSDIDVGTDTGHYRDLTYNYCNNCGEVWNVEFD